MVTYVKNDMPSILVHSYFGDRCESLCVKVRVSDYTVNIVNFYVPDKHVDVDSFPQFVYNESTLLVGHLNTLHNELGSVGRARNVNGWSCYTYLHGC